MAERWEIIFLWSALNLTNAEYVNGEIAKCPGYEPFDSYWSAGTWALLLKRKLEHG